MISVTIPLADTFSLAADAQNQILSRDNKAMHNIEKKKIIPHNLGTLP